MVAFDRRVPSTVAFAVVAVLVGWTLLRLTVLLIVLLDDGDASSQEKHHAVVVTKLSHEDADDAIKNSLNLIQPRPRDLRLVFLGDSVTRYQYLSLAYFLRHGRWFDPSIQAVNNLVNAHSFHHLLHPDEDWNEFFLQSNRMLYPMEVCDCLRSRDGDILVERRYFYDKGRNNLAVYINMNGNKTHPGRGYYGRLDATEIFGANFQELAGLPLGMNMSDYCTNRKASIQWEYNFWGDVIRHHIGALNLSQGAEPFMILNAGLHPHDFRHSNVSRDVKDALDEIGVVGVWKTTTYHRQYLIEYQHEQATNDAAVPPPHVRRTDVEMCKLLGRCFNLSWTNALRPEFYFDDLHFLEPVYRIFNEEFFDRIGVLPDGYTKFDSASFLVVHENDR